MREGVSAVARQASFNQGQCPCCGQHFEFKKVHVSLETNAISFGDQTVFLTPQLAEIMSVLAEHAPMVVTNDLMFERVWGGLSDTEPKILKVQIRKLRQALEPLPLKVETIWNVGYRLVIQERAATAALTVAAPEPASVNRRPQAGAGSLIQERA